jgi:hypothetical protein
METCSKRFSQAKGQCASYTDGEKIVEQPEGKLSEEVVQRLQELLNVNPHKTKTMGNLLRLVLRGCHKTAPGLETDQHLGMLCPCSPYSRGQPRTLRSKPVPRDSGNPETELMPGHCSRQLLGTGRVARVE